MNLCPAPESDSAPPRLGSGLRRLSQVAEGEAVLVAAANALRRKENEFLDAGGTAHEGGHGPSAAAR